MHPRQQSGFTLIEVVLSMTIVGVLIGSLYVVSTVAIEQSSAQQETQQSIGDAHRVLSEIETAIRLSEQCVKSGGNVLVLETRYFIDTDAGTEQVAYIYNEARNTLSRRVNDEGAGFGDAEVLLENATGFTTSSLRIVEDFDRSDFDVDEAGPIPTGDTRSFDTSVQAEYSLRELGDVDPDLLAAYSDEKERLEVTGQSNLTPTTLTVTPPLDNKATNTTTTFTPLDDGAEYRPLVYGAEAPDTSNVSLVFAPNQSVILRTTVGGSLIGQEVAGFNWEATSTYTVTLALQGSEAQAYVATNGGTPQHVGSVPTSSLTMQPIHYQVVTLGAQANWDSLEVEYDFHELSLSSVVNGETKTLYGGACSRQPESE